MVTIFIIHGYAGHSRENWFPWLKEELEKQGHQVIIPDFPTPQQPDFKEWQGFFERYSKKINEKTIVIGHSLGGAFLLSLLEEHKLRAAFLVAAVSGPIEHEVDKKIKTFTHKMFDFRKIKRNCSNFYVLHSNNDPFIPLPEAWSLADHLGVEVTLINNGGHLNLSAGFKTFPLLLGMIENAINTENLS